MLGQSTKTKTETETTEGKCALEKTGHDLL